MQKSKKKYYPTQRKNANATAQSIVVNDIRIQSADRNRKDIQSFKMALIGAESVTNPNRTRLYDLYEDISLDGHLTGIIEKRIAKTINKNLYFQDAKKKHIKEFDKLIDSKVFRDVVKRILESKFWGVSGLEFIPGQELKFNDIPRKHIKPNLKKITYLQSGIEGIDYEGAPNLWVIGDDKDLGVLLKCSPYAIWKRGAFADYSQYIEIFGQPIRIVKYDAYDSKTQSDLKHILDESGSSLALMIPKQADFEMMDGKTSNATGELQDRFRLACNQEMTILILGAEGSTTNSKSSGYAQSVTHQEEEDEIIKSDLQFVRSMLNSDYFLSILKSYGYPVDGGEFVYEKEANLTELKTRLEIDTVVSQKVPIEDDYWYETYGINKPENYNELKKLKESQQQNTQEVNQDGTNSQQETIQRKVKLGLFESWRAALADFFDRAH